jgi:F like protein
MPHESLQDLITAAARAVARGLSSFLRRARALFGRGGRGIDGWPAASTWAEHVVPPMAGYIRRAYLAPWPVDAVEATDAAERYLRHATNRLSASRWPTDTFNTIRGLLADAAASGDDPVPEILRRLGPAANASWAQMVADTEIRAAYNAGTLAAAEADQRDLGQTLFKTWHARLDSRCRDAHRAANGQTVLLDVPFVVGGELLHFPGDPTASPAQIINCRCELRISHSITASGDPVTTATLSPNWAGPLAPLNVDSADGRRLALPPGEPTTRPLPLPLLYQDALSQGHSGAVPVGVIDKVNLTDDGSLWGEGRFDLEDPRAADVARKVSDGMLGWISVDLDNTVFELDERDPDKPVEVATDWRLAGATLVAQPAFAEGAKIAIKPKKKEGEGAEEQEKLPGEPLEVDVEAKTPPDQEAEVEVDEKGEQPTEDEEDERKPKRKAPVPPRMADEDAETFTVLSPPSAPIGEDVPWDGSGAKHRLLEHATKPDGSVDGSKLAQGYLYRDPSGDPNLAGSYKFPIADVKNGKLVVVPAAVRNASARIATAQIPGPDKERLHSVIAGLEKKIGIGPEAKKQQATVAEDIARAMALTAAAGPIAPPRTWFNNPGFTQPTPIQVTEDGQVFGHLAQWNTPHIGASGRQVFAPHSTSDYRHFHVGYVVTAEGDQVATGTLTAGTGHAAHGLTAAESMAHYSDSGYAVAAVRAGEDDFGIWVAGALTADASETQVATLRRCPLSGDWREIGGNLELVAALAVNNPGFRLPRASVYVDAARRPVSLVAAGVIDPGAQAVDEFSVARIAQAAARATLDEMDRRRLAAENDARAAAATAAIAKMRATRTAVLKSRVATARAPHKVGSSAAFADDGKEDSDAWAEFAATDEQAAEVDELLAMDEFKNWVSQTGGLPKYIKRISKHLRRKGMTQSRAIATAVNVVKKMCRTGDLQWPGQQQVNLKSRAQACAAVASWEAKKAAARAKKG